MPQAWKVRVEPCVSWADVCHELDQQRIGIRQLLPVQSRAGTATKVFGRQFAAVTPQSSTFSEDARSRGHMLASTDDLPITVPPPERATSIL